MHATERGRGGGRIEGALSEAINYAEWRLTFEAWRVVTTSRYMADELADYFKLPRDKIDIVPNGVATPLGFEAGATMGGLPAELRTVRRRFAADAQKLVCFVGRLVHEKGPGVLLEAAPRVLFEVPEARFVIAGRGPMLNELRDRVGVLGLADRVSLPGYISDWERNALYGVSDVAVFPSSYEPFGIVALEAMAAGAPIVVARAGGLAELVEDGSTGVVVPPGDVSALAVAIIGVLMDEEAARHRAETARLLVDTRYGWEGIARSTRALYQQVVAERASVDW
jgi:1,4-alpha-glucan branching enzyme